MPPRSQGQSCGGPVWSAYRCAFCGCGDGFAGLDDSVDGLSSAGRLGQAASLLVTQF